MAFCNALATAALFAGAAALQLSSVPQTPADWKVPGVVNISALKKTARLPQTQRSEQLLGPPMLEENVCQMFEDVPTEKNSEWKHDDPIIFPEAGIGASRRMVSLGGMEYQLFLPRVWTNNSLTPFPVVVYFHSWGERKWSLMNSESLPRLLKRNQSTSFSGFQCWCTNKTKFTGGEVKVFPQAAGLTVQTTDPTTWSGPMADCNFADTMKAIVIMPKASEPPAVGPRREAEGLGPHYPTWVGTSDFSKVQAITKFIIKKFNGDADQVILTGAGDGASGALAMAKADPKLYSALILTDPTEGLSADGIDYMPVMVSSDAADGASYTDAFVTALKSRSNGAALTKYYRFLESPPAQDPGMRKGKHTGDLVYKSPDVWKWAFGLFSGQFYERKDYSGVLKWGLSEKGWVDMSYNPTMPPLDSKALVPGKAGDSYNPTRPPATFGYVAPAISNKAEPEAEPEPEAGAPFSRAK